jgi:hypothetical protein
MSTPAKEESRVPIERLYRYLDRLIASAFYGKVTLSFQHGKVCDVKIEQTRKLEEL